MYCESFKKLIEESPNETYIGRGNPNASVLFVGKEYSKHDHEEYFNVKYWKEKILNEEAVSLNHKKEVKEGHTWNKYQKLYDVIFDKQPTDHFNFEENVFTTEMNKNASTKTKNANKEGMVERKQTVLSSSFFKEFPVIVLACSNYIRSQEFCEMFNVTFLPNGKKYPNDESNSMSTHFWTHYSGENFVPKLVIHTRQLSGDVSNKLLKEMGGVIRDFLIKNNIKF